MAPQPVDKFIDEFDALARDLETRAAITPPASLRRDIRRETIVRRIRRAVEALLDAAGIGGARTLSFSVQDADGLKVHAGRSTRSWPVWANRTGQTFTITRITANSDTDNYVFGLYKSASLTDISTGNDVLIAPVTCADNGTGCFTAELVPPVTTIEDSKWLIWEHTSGTADVLSVEIEGYFASN